MSVDVLSFPFIANSPQQHFILIFRPRITVLMNVKHRLTIRSVVSSLFDPEGASLLIFLKEDE